MDTGDAKTAEQTLRTATDRKYSQATYMGLKNAAGSAG